MMGAGKSTLGAKLAELLGWQFEDTDALIEKTAGISISEIFSKRGAEVFRAMETDAIKSLSTRGNCVVALGGGALLDVENIDTVLHSGTLVYLQLSAESAMERFDDGSTADRPLLDAAYQQLEDQAKQGSFLKLMQDRMPGYKRAHLTISIDRLTIDESVALLRETLTEHEFSFPAQR